MMTARAMLARLERAWKKWPPELAREARAYTLGGRSDGELRVHLSQTLDYPWLLLPAWLLASRRRQGADRAFLADILWGQYALFLFVRIHDDLVDRQASSPWLVYVGDRYLVEAENAFARHLHGRFWPIFRRCVADSIDGIAEVDSLQRRARPSLQDLFSAYARVSSIFKVGSAAILIRLGRMQWFGPVSAFKDDLAVVSQVLDDLTDLDEDLSAGRRNAVAAALLATRGRRAATAGRVRESFAWQILWEDGLSELFDELERRLARSGRRVAPLKLKPAEQYLASYQAHVRDLRRSVHRARVGRLFGAIR